MFPYSTWLITHPVPIWLSFFYICLLLFSSFYSFIQHSFIHSFIIEICWAFIKSKPSKVKNESDIAYMLKKLTLYPERQRILKLLCNMKVCSWIIVMTLTIYWVFTIHQAFCRTFVFIIICVSEFIFIPLLQIKEFTKFSEVV